MRELAEFLGWPVFDLDPVNPGSALIHETARRTHAAFARAAAAAPSIILLEELDALGGNRAGAALYRAEEVDQLLRGLRRPAGRLVHQPGEVAEGPTLQAGKDRIDMIDLAGAARALRQR